jgi:type II secretory pathway component GspD/PulD (secretin)
MPQTRKQPKLFIALAFTIIIALIALSAPGAYAQSQGVYSIAAGASKIINISEPIKRVSVGNPGIAEYTVLSKNEIIILGVKVGRTELHLWTDNDFKTFVIKVYDDIVEMRAKLNDIMGPEIAKSLSIHIAKETAVIKGAVTSVYESEQVEKIAQLYYPKILNLLEIKNKNMPLTPATGKSTAQFKPDVETLGAGANDGTAIAAAQEQYPQINTGNTKDILEIKAVEKIKETTNAYGAGAAPGFSGTPPLQSAVIPKLYYDGINDKTTRIITLQNAIASDLEAALNKMKSPDGMIIKDDRTNSLVLIDKPATIEKMEKMVKIFDAPTPQVLIEAKIVEVSLNDDMKNTLNWIYDTLYGGANPLGTALNNKSVKISDGTMDFALDYGKISSDHFAMKILPSLQKRHARLISSPSTVTLDKKEATFGVTDNIPYLKYTPQGTTGTLLPTPEYVSPAPGVTLRVTPNINQNDVIRMNISVMIGSFVENVNFGQYGSVPRTSSRQSTNFVEVNNGETLIISGLISNRSYNSANKVPWFSKIPLVGSLFESKLKGEERTELVIFITPRIVGKDSRFAQLDKDKFPRIVENKMPDVDDKFDMKKFLGIKKDGENEAALKPSAEKALAVEKKSAPAAAPVVETLVSQPKTGRIEYRYTAGGPDLNKTKKIFKTESRNFMEVKTSAAEKNQTRAPKQQHAIVPSEGFEPEKAEAPAEIKPSIRPAFSPAVQSALRETISSPAAAEPERAKSVCVSQPPASIEENPTGTSKFRSERANELVEKLRLNMNRKKRF